MSWQASLDDLSILDAWLHREAPKNHVVMSSRARYARNLPRLPFPLRAAENELQAVARAVEAGVRNAAVFRDGFHFNLGTVSPQVRAYLRESQLISPELENAANHRHLFLSRDIRVAVMTNEEDHLRIFAIQPGLQALEVLTDLVALETELAETIPFAFSPRFGYLTACPTNTGTGLRISIMMHLPGLAQARQIHDVTASLSSQGMVGRGFRGENSNSLGDLYQISNDVTLGVSEERIAKNIMTMIEHIIDREESARRDFAQRNRTMAEDEAGRALGVLSHCRDIAADEALQLLSRLRYGILLGMLPGLSHEALNVLMVKIQPAHLLRSAGGESVRLQVEGVARADFLRSEMKAVVA